MTSLAKLAMSLAISLGLAAPAAAQDAAYGGSAAVGLAFLPEYEGSDDGEVLPYVAARIGDASGRYLEFQGTSLRANLLRSDRIEAGPVLTYRPGRGDDVSNLAVAALPEIDAAVELGAFVAYSVPSGDGAFRFSAELLQDASDVHGGWQGSLSAGYATSLGQRWSLGGAVNARIVSDDYAATYFGVTAAGAAASGLAAYDAGGGLKDLGIDLTVSYAISDRAAVTGFVGYRRLIGDFADSPIVASGSADQISVGLAYARRF